MQESRMYTFNTFCRQRYGEKVYRLSLNPGTTCPNRDGSKGIGGCTFCSAGGSSEFAGSPALPVPQQLESAKALVMAKGARRFLSYFQAFTGTYAPLPVLESLYRDALEPADVVGLSIATRPDCISESLLQLLFSLRSEYKKDIFLEFGIQTVNDDIANECNLCHTFNDFRTAAALCHHFQIPIIAHMILGLPGETPEQMIDGIDRVCAIGIDGIKLSLLHILKDTPMEARYLNRPDDFPLLEEDDYIDVLLTAISHIPGNVVIHRITGDGSKALLIAPQFTANKKAVLNRISREMELRDIRQGSLTKIPYQGDRLCNQKP